eukprot:1194669-Prorocentrum_minimum.AAC.4
MPTGTDRYGHTDRKPDGQKLRFKSTISKTDMVIVNADCNIMRSLKQRLETQFPKLVFAPRSSPNERSKAI